MTTAPRPRFSVRAGLTATPDHDGPFENVPAHLLVPLQEWVADASDVEALYDEYDEDVVERTICLRLRIAPPTRRTHGVSAYRLALVEAVGPQLLDVIDAVLAYKAEHGMEDLRSVRMLTDLLDEAGSAYRVTEAADGLEERVTPGVRDAVRRTLADAAAVPTAGSAADHLATAWQASYGRSPDPVRAYGEAIKAVECAAHAVIQPKHAKATLGTMLGEIKAARHKFTTVIPTPADATVAMVEAMMRTLWDGQTSRHGAQTETVPETLEAARAGVHLAATLVQWFISGAVVRTP